MQDEWLLQLQDLRSGKRYRLWIDPGTAPAVLGITFLLDPETRRILPATEPVGRLRIPFGALLIAQIEPEKGEQKHAHHS